MMGPNGSAFGVQYVTQTIRFASELDCPMVDTVDGAFETPGLSRKEVFRVTCDNYRQCLSWAEDYRIVINVEPHGPYTNDIEFMQNLFEHFDSEYLRCNFDTGNSFIAGHNPLDYLKALRKYVVHCRIKDVSAPSTLYGLSVRRLISFDLWLPSHGASRFRSCFGLMFGPSCLSI
jgi:sugar phosphate isomerase/epimerase